MERHGLSEPCSVVFYRDVAERDVVAVHLHGVCAEGSHLAVGSGDEYVGVVIISYDGVFGVFSAYLDVGEP